MITHWQPVLATSYVDVLAQSNTCTQIHDILYRFNPYTAKNYYHNAYHYLGLYLVYVLGNAFKVDTFV